MPIFGPPNVVNTFSRNIFGGVPAIAGLREVSVGPLAAASGNNVIITCGAGKKIIPITIFVYNSSVGSITQKLIFKRSSVEYELPVSGTALSASIAAGATGNNQFIFTVLEEGDQLIYNTSGTGMNMWVRLLELPATAPVKTARLFSIPNTDTVLYTTPSGFIAHPVGITTPIAPTTSAAPMLLNKSGSSKTISYYIPTSGSTTSATDNLASTGTAADGTILTTPLIPAVLVAGQSVVVKADTSGAGAIFLNLYEFPVS